MNIRVNDCQETAQLGNQTVVIVPPGARIGGFTKQLSGYCNSPEAALNSSRHYSGDKLIKQLWNGKWQCFARRANARGAGHPKDYDFPLSGRRAKKHTAGTGKTFFQPMPHQLEKN